MINKAVILCGGFATRFMPVCKGVPKELLPLYDTPIVQVLVDDLMKNGVKEITFVIRKGKECIADYFSFSKKWQKILQNTPSYTVFERMRNIKINFVYQKRQLGTGNALLSAKKYCNEPFYLLNGDEIIENTPSFVCQLRQAYAQSHSPIMGLFEVEQKDAHKYGMLEFENSEQLLKLTRVHEKPKNFVAKRYLCNLGGYVLTPQIFCHISTSKTQQVPITDALNEYFKDQDTYGIVVKGKRYDMGNPMGYALANISHLYTQPVTHNAVKEYLTKLLQK